MHDGQLGKGWSCAQKTVRIKETEFSLEEMKRAVASDSKKLVFRKKPLDSLTSGEWDYIMSKGASLDFEKDSMFRKIKDMVGRKKTENREKRIVERLLVESASPKVFNYINSHYQSNADLNEAASIFEARIIHLKGRKKGTVVK